MNSYKLRSVKIESLERHDYMIAVLLRTYLSHMDENTALEKLSAVVDPRVIGIHPVEPVHTKLNGEKLTALIDEAADVVASEQERSDALAAAVDSDPAVDDMKSAMLEYLRSIDGRKVVDSITADFADFITRCYYALRF